MINYYFITEKTLKEWEKETKKKKKKTFGIHDGDNVYQYKLITFLAEQDC